MSKCKFTKELERLRKSSRDSIDNVERMDEFKKYMHVVRNVEDDLKNILKNVNRTGKKTLVLLCGSAGDGKSHMLSYLKNADQEHLLDEYTVYNDATESNAPSKTAIETLSELLNEFSDVNLDLPGKNIILAINLGVLSNFIESEYGKDFSALKKYVDKNNILSTQINNDSQNVISNFQHVSFSDYHMFSLREKSVEPDYINNIMSKIFNQNSENIFFDSYQTECFQCPLAQHCPVKANFEYMMNENCREYVANLMVRVTVVDKAILTTREILNYIYDVLVPQQFNKSELERLAADESEYIKEYFKEITPALMFDYRDLTVLMNQIKRFDPLQIRNEESDEFAMEYYVTSNISKKMLKMIKDTPYGEFLADEDKLSKINNDKELKLQLFNALVRIQTMIGAPNDNDIYHDYLRDLYYYNAGKKRKLGKIYSMVENSVIQWCGSEADGNICLDDHYEGFNLYEDITFEAYLDNVPKEESIDSLQRFISEIIVQFEDKDEKKIITLNIDYSLYALMYKLNRGYVQTADDRNNHADFISFVTQILKTGSSDKNLVIVDENGSKAIIEKSKFGYKFKVVK